MVPPLVWIGGIAVVGWTAKQFGDAFEDSSKLVKWATIGGAVYVSYQALKSAGAIK